VERPHLLSRLKGGTSQRLTLVSAPAGFGKTTLLAAWAHSSLDPIAWLSLDEADNSMERFLRYLVSALQKALPGVGAGALTMLQTPVTLQPAQILASLINDLEQQSQLTILVLDDIHILENQDIFHLIDALLDHLPDSLHLVLSGRSDPPLSLARLRACGELNELRGTDLRFSTQEAAVFLNQVMGLTLSPEQIEALETRTEGWIAGLQLAALSMRDREDTGRFIKVFTGSHRYILDYLVEEVLHSQSEEVQEFLLRTAVLERLTASLCEALIDKDDPGESSQDLRGGRTYWAEVNPLIQTGSSSFIPHPSSLDSSFILELLERSNLFLIPLDDERTWYRYHTLFADLLRFRLEQAHPELVPVLHRRAASWFEERGLPFEAVGHYASAGDFSKAGKLCSETGEILLNQGQVNRFLGWLDTLPGEILAANPRLHLMYAWSLLSLSEFARIEPQLSAAEAGIQALPAAEREARGPYWKTALTEIAATRAILSSMQGDLIRTIQLSNQALADLPEDQSMRSSILIGLGVAYRMTGEIRLAETAFAESAHSAIQSHQSMVAIAALCNQADALVEQGQIRRAGEVLRQALQLANQDPASPQPSASLAYGSLSEIYYEQNDLPAALETVRQALDLDTTWGNQDIHVSNLTRLARILLATGEPAGAIAALRQARETDLRQPLSPHVAIFLATEEAYFHTRLGGEKPDWSALQERVSKAGPGMEALQQLLDLCQSGIWVSDGLARKDAALLEQACSTLEGLIPAFQTAGVFNRVIDASAHLALALNALGRPERAAAALLAALRLAQPENILRPFLDQGKAMGLLIEDCRMKIEADDQPAVSAFAERLISLFAREGSPSTAQAAAFQEPQSHRDAPHSTIYTQKSTIQSPLSSREIEVLQLVERGLSNQEIAHRLTLSPGTVKRHIHNIFEKLDAASRPQAVHKARELGIL